MNDLNTTESKQKLQNYILEAERLQSKRKSLNEEIKETFEGAKREGFDVKAMKEILKLRKKDSETRNHEEEIREFYKDILIKE